MAKIYDMERLYRDYGIEHATVGTKHCRPGWVQTACPFCSGTTGDHLGYNLVAGYFNCWRCGSHRVNDVLCLLLNISFRQVDSVLSGYVLRKKRKRHDPVSVVTSRKQKHLGLPLGTKELKEQHRGYLIKRKYDPDELVAIWGLKGTGAIGPYKFRVIAPITVNEQLVSYQGRDYTGRHLLKYKACPKEQEVIHHKHIVYGMDQCFDSDILVVVEGITDAWRLGPGAVATFGIKYTTPQIKTIARLASNFRRTFILFDSEVQAQQQAQKLRASLQMVFIDVVLKTVPKDPGALSQDDALLLMTDFRKNIFTF